jgi:hypothetical protein
MLVGKTLPIRVIIHQEFISLFQYLPFHIVIYDLPTENRHRQIADNLRVVGDFSETGQQSYADAVLKAKRPWSINHCKEDPYVALV